jgi:cell division protein FtsB
VYALADSKSGLLPWWALHQELVSAQAHRAELEAANTALEAEIRELEHSPFATERAVREVLGFAKPGELVIRMPKSGLVSRELTVAR